MADEIAIERSSRNISTDLGFEEPEIELAKARLSGKIAEEIAARDWTQRRAADVLGIDQPRVSLLVRGKTSQFSLERLIELLGRLSDDVRIAPSIGTCAPSSGVKESGSTPDRRVPP